MIEIPEASKNLLEGKRFIDLFAGLGGFRLALESLGAECVWSNEIDRYACETYRDNFGDDPTGDITRVDVDDVPDHDILCAGFPCQAFSIAGKQRGFTDPDKGTLFFDVARIVRAKKPEVVFMENVRNFAQHDGGNTLCVVKATMENMGYSFSWKVLSANKYGAATKRDRVYMVCIRKDLGIDGFEFPAECGAKSHVEDILLPDSDSQVAELWKDIDDSDINWEREDIEGYSDNPVRLGTVAQGRQGERIYSTHGTAVTISASGGGVFAKTGGYLVNGKVRTLAPREAARVMGFPDTYKFHGKRTQALKQFGNSVVVDVLQRIALEFAETVYGSMDEN